MQFSLGGVPTMRRSMIPAACALAWCASTACFAQDFLVSNPKITGVFVTPVDANQCSPVKISFTLTNATDRIIYSQRPYSGDNYTLYQSFATSGVEALPDRYMVGVSVNGGKDGYPYRWGFRGALSPGRTTTIAGLLTLLEVGGYELTGMLFKGGSTADMRLFKIGKVSVDACVPVASPPQPVRAPPIYPVINGQPVNPPVIPYVMNGYTYFPARPFFYNIGADIYVVGQTVVAAWPGAQLVMYPGTPNAVYNGLPIVFPAPIYVINGVTYVPPRFVSALMGGSFYWDPYTRQMLINYPPYWW